MIKLDIPGRGAFQIEHLFLDVNGTLAVDGNLIEGVAERLKTLSEQVEVIVLTADTHGRQAAIDALLGMSATRITPGSESEQKAAAVEKRGAKASIAIGNGGNDAGMLAAAAISIAVLGPEGLNSAALRAADIVVTSPLDALDLLLNPRRLVATLRR